MKAKPHGINFTDADWQKVCDLADEHETTPAAYVNYIVGLYVSKDWQGLKPRGWNRYSEKIVNSDTPTD